MSPFLIAFFAAAGVSAWVYNKTMRYTGNNTQNSIIMTAATGIIIFIIFLTIVSFVDSAVAK